MYRQLVALNFVQALKHKLTGFNDKVTQSEQKTVAYMYVEIKKKVLQNLVWTLGNMFQVCNRTIIKQMSDFSLT